MRVTSFVGLSFVAVFACSRASEPSSDSFAPVASHAPSDASASARPVVDASVAAADAGGPRSDLEAFCNAAFMADGDMLKAKCTDKDYQSSLGLERSAARFCATHLTTLFGFGRTKLDSAAGTACASAVKTAAETAIPGATETFFTIAPCDRVVTGTVKEGGACRWPPECGDGLTCVGYAVGVDGACKKPAKVDGACTTQVFGGVFNETALSLHHPSCAKGAYCDGKACVARAADGATCTASKTCGEGHACVMGKCAKARAAIGEDCAIGDDCAVGLTCDSAKCIEKKSAGASCTKDQCKGWCDIPEKPPGQTSGTCVASCGSG